MSMAATASVFYIEHKHAMHACCMCEELVNMAECHSNYVT